MKESLIILVITNVGQSIKRVRTTLIISVIASILGFISFYNTLDNGWGKAKVDHRLNLKNWCEEFGEDSLGNKDTLYYPKGKLQNLEFQRRYKNNSNLCENANEIALNAQIQRDQRVTKVRIPWLGIVFDINDLLLLGGLSFAVIMLMLSYILGLKYSNLYSAFRMISKVKDSEERSSYFDAIAMAQILNLPDSNTKGNDPIILVFLPYILFALPFFVQTIVLVNDLSTSGLVLSQNTGTTIFSLICGGVFWFILLSLTINCVRIDRKTDKLWDEYTELLKEEESN